MGCEKDSGGTCFVGSCDESRGPTWCNSRRQCECIEGYCMIKGRCRSSLVPLPTVREMNPWQCDKQTTDSCYLLSCSRDLGPATCQNWQCECADYHCWRGGRCVYSSVKAARSMGGFR